MKLQIANVYFSMLTMVTEITAYLGLQDFLFFSRLDLFSYEQQFKRTICTHPSIERIKSALQNIPMMADMSCSFNVSNSLTSCCGTPSML